LAYSRGIALVDRLRSQGARVSAYDPLLSEEEIASIGVPAWRWGTPADARALVTQTADGSWGRLDPRWFGRLEVVYDGRRAMDDVVFPGHVKRLSVGRADGSVARRPSDPGGA
jgi:UDP-glucose 6-dehydrogenase